METFKVSICCITYNHENFIAKCLDGLINQETNFEYEIILGEDESSDNTRDICKQYKQKYPDKIKLFLRSRKDVIFVDNNPTGRYNFTENLIASSGKYIAICEGDDYWVYKNKLQKQVDFLETHPNYSFCWTRFKTLNQNTQELALDFNDKHFPNNEEVIDFDFEKSFKGWHMGTQTLVFRNTFFDRNVIKNFKYFRDVHLIAQLLKKGNGACLNFVGAHYRIHDGGLHSTISEYNGYKMGYNCNREIYLDNKTEPFVKKKYILAFQNFININIKQGYLFKAFRMSIQLFFLNWSVIDLLTHQKRILTKLIKPK